MICDLYGSGAELNTDVVELCVQQMCSINFIKCVK